MTTTQDMTKKTNGTARTTIERTMHIIPIDRIQESAFNPRKTFTGIDDLAENIAEHGVLQPLLVRPIGSGYEIVYGARRFRAAKKAKMTHVPCEIRELDDASALELCVVENCQRVDVHPLEEAEGYEVLHTKHKLSVEEIAAKVNKSVAQIYARMKLCDLIPEARKAFYDGKLTAGVAILLARLAEAVQKDALKDLTPGWRQGDPMSVREAGEMIGQRYHLKLADAPFDRNDATLVAAAGACGPCPKRTGNQTELFADVKNRDTCTDAKCYAEKKDAAWKKQSKEAKEKGIKVFVAGPADYNVPAGYIDLNGTCYADPKKRTYRELFKSDVPEIDALWRSTDGTVKELISRATTQAAAKKAGHKFLNEPEIVTPSKSPAKKTDTRLERLTAQLARNAIVSAVERRDDARPLWRAIIHELDLGGDVGINDVLERRGVKTNQKAALAKMKEEQLRGIVAEMIMGVRDDVAQHLNAHVHEHIESFADDYGVDLKKIAKDAKTKLEAADELKKAAPKPAKKK